MRPAQHPGPDYSNGWGLLNTAAAAAVLSDQVFEPHIFELELFDGTVETINVESDGTTPLRATIVWTDQPGIAESTLSLDPPTAKLVNDLDLRIVDPALQVLDPWVLDPANPGAAATTGDNFRDNVEQLHIASPAPGSYTIEISHKGILAGGPSQQVSLVVTGNLSMTPPVINSTPTTTAIENTPYSYDSDDRVEASGTIPITFALVSGPAGMTVSSTGLVTWTPTTAQIGTHPVTIDAQNSFGTDTQNFSIDVSAAPSVLLSDDFNDNNFDGWSIVDEGTISAPSIWSTATGTLTQSANIYSNPTGASVLPKLGTYAQYDAGSTWTDYRASFTLRANDNDDIGFMFRVQAATTTTTASPGTYNVTTSAWSRMWPASSHYSLRTRLVSLRGSSTMCRSPLTAPPSRCA
jgi:hypothetical protein